MSTTTNACTFDDLLRGTKGYCLQECLSSLKSLSFEEAVHTLKTKIKTVINNINELNVDYKAVETFTIGKSFVRQRHTAGSHLMPFDDMNPCTWKLADGVNSRWKNFYAKDGYDGLFVLCVTPRNTIPVNSMKVGPQLYAIALEQRLIQDFCFLEKDNRLGNTSFDVGSKAEEPFAGLVYFAYKLSESPITDERWAL